MLQASIRPHRLIFKQPAGTSRGVYTERNVWYITLEEGNRRGIGEIAPLPNLSCDDRPDLPEMIKKTLHTFNGTIDYKALQDYPSLLFGLESALRNFQRATWHYFDNDFTDGKRGIEINGLIWMGTYEEMKQRIREKLDNGFRCIKLKIGAINFEDEYDLLQRIRREYSADDVTLRVDANGGFSPSDALEKLDRLSKLDIHSIEQPIRANQWEEMARLCEQSPLPIALDEELIGVNDRNKKIQLLDTIHPAYIILKPSLHGGFYGSNEWIELAKKRNIGYWATSALESNVGLCAIAQWAATLDVDIPQGLGTGALFVNNIDAPLQVIGQELWFNKSVE